MVHHGEGLLVSGGDHTLLELLRAGRHAEVPDARERAMLEHAVALTRSPAGVREADVQRLRSAGWSDAAVLDITLVTAYFNFVNRVADGLGVELEPGRG
ncbi:MAG: peroxidase [Planctomycetes bacterium]|nr:peroxidase [Planctomycetota bacterium]